MFIPGGDGVFHPFSCLHGVSGDTISDDDHGPIEREDKEVRAEPYPLPDGFSWCTIDMLDPAQRKEVYTLLVENYVEADDASFRFCYSEDFLLWCVWMSGLSVSPPPRLPISPPLFPVISCGLWHTTQGIDSSGLFCRVACWHPCDQDRKAVRLHFRGPWPYCRVGAVRGDSILFSIFFPLYCFLVFLCTSVHQGASHV